ncbi:MAG TPA: sigma-E factor negative regulatory protein [Aquabacterium sp.]|uniref:sigma-E factor negative regulatory protein n=1 Tax=Aquabacterium sp. TaxID=1872578 RepID=UPI002E304981|nr:sigma-E factor negative regulatory protein [Aquabacterium sp.]HEX5356769.1 sigma-E factor negative regulatory protein [Aquabacterium sp.]
MSDRFSDSDAARLALSALADGEAQPQEVARACAAWRDQPDARAAWHTYQMIGDVMRSEDLAETSAGNAFLNKFRERLAQEPVVLAPSAAQAAQAQRAAAEAKAPVAVVHPLKRRAWAGPMAVAAGFVMVVGALMSSQLLPGGNATNTGDATVAQAGSGFMQPAGGVVNGFVPVQWTGGVVAEPGRMPGLSIGSGASFSRPGDVVIVRDPRLDQALATEHGGQGADPSFAAQGALMRQVVFDGR